MQATITYLLTEQAQRAQMAATGQPVARKQTMTVEVTAEDLPLCKVAEDGSLSVDVFHAPHENALVVAGWAKGNPDATQFAPDVLADIRHGRAMMADAYCAACAAASQYVIDTPGVAMENPECSYQVYVPLDVLPDSSTMFASSGALRVHPRVNHDKLGAKTFGIYSSDLSLAAQQALRDHYRIAMESRAIQQNASIDAFLAHPTRRLNQPRWNSEEVLTGNAIITAAHPRYAELRDAVIARNNADAVESAAKLAALDQAKKDYIATWITEHADPETQSQFADGLLCRKAAVSLIADAAFAAAGVPERAKWNDTFCDSSSCPCGEKSLDCLPRSVYPAWKALKASLPKGYAVEFLRVRECLKSDDDYGQDGGETAGPAIYLAKLTIPHGPFSFERTVRLG